jgi:hypothetical protein
MRLMLAEADPDFVLPAVADFLASQALIMAGEDGTRALIRAHLGLESPHEISSTTVCKTGRA